MPVKSLDSQILQYLPLLEKKEKQSILSQIRSFLVKKEISSRTAKDKFIEQYNKDIADAEQEVASGHFILQEDLEKESETW